MFKDTDYPDDRTVIVNRQGEAAADSSLTDFNQTPRFEQLEERMIYAARLRPAEHCSVSLNPLVAAAAELLSELVAIKSATRSRQLEGLQEQLSTGIKAFEHRALHAGVENSQVMAARYVLCTVLDEAVVTTSWGNESQWSRMSLLSHFHNETFGGEKFFQLLERLSRNPARHLALLELMYLCLSLGFEGKYRVLSRGMLELESIRDTLYRQIRTLRGDTPRELSPHWQGLRDVRRRLLHIVPWWLVALICLVCLGALYGGFAWVLNQESGRVINQYDSLQAVEQQH